MEIGYGLFFLVLGIILTIVGIIVFIILKKRNVRPNKNIGIGLITGGIVMLYIFVRVYVLGGTLE